MPSQLYLASNNIDVFPTTRRSYDKQASSRFISEYAITSMTNRLVTNKNYMITRSFSSMSDPVEFVIQGYYFKISSLQTLVDLFADVSGDKSKIYAYINLDSFNDLIELAGEDINNVYNGVSFTETLPTGNNYLLLILKNSSSGSFTIDNISIPETSLEIFDDYNIDININGGDLDVIFP